MSKMPAHEETSAIFNIIRDENSIIMKFFRDPACPKIAYVVLSLLQLFLFGIGEGGMRPVFAIVISGLTFLVSFVFLLLIASKKTHLVEKFILLRLLVGRQELSWSGIYYIYTIAFGTLNGLVHIHTIYFTCNYHGNEVHQVMIAIIGLVMMLVYYMEAYRTYENYAEDKAEMKDEKFGLKIYTGFLGVVGCCPAFTKIVVVALTTAWLMIDPIFHIVEPELVFAGYDANGLRTYALGGWEGFDDFWSSYEGSGWMTIIMAAVIIFMATFGVFFSLFGSKMLVRSSDNFASYGISFGITCMICATSFLGLGFGCAVIGGHNTPSKFYGILSMVTLLMVLGEAHVKPHDMGFQKFEEEERKSQILPKNLAKSIMDPVASDAIKCTLVLDDVIVKQ